MNASNYCSPLRCWVDVRGALSAFVGPLGGGYLQDKLGFEMAAVVVGSFSLFAVGYFYIVLFTVL